MRKLILSIMMVGGFTAWAGAQELSTEPHCGRFDVGIGESDVHLQKLNDSDSLVGNRRAGTYELVGSDGVIGYILFTSTVVQSLEGSHRLIGDAHHVYDNGTVHYKMVYQLPDPSKPDIARSPNPQVIFHVTGGTGDFTGARGTISSFRDVEGRAIQHVDLTCGNG